MTDPRCLAAALAALCLLAGARAQCLTANDAATPGAAARGERAALSQAQHEFSLTMLRDLAFAQPGSNVFFSPHSTYQALLLAYFGAANHTERSLKKALRIPDDQDKAATFRAFKLGEFLRRSPQAAAGAAGGDGPGSELLSVSRLWVAERVTLRSCVADLLGEAVERLAVAADPEAAAARVNAWVEEQTRGQIKDLIPGLSPEAALVLTNAAYFKGAWAAKFPAERTRKEVFHVSHKKQSLVPMMKQKGTFSYVVSERLGAHVLELPYAGTAVSMLVFLPPFVMVPGEKGGKGAGPQQNLDALLRRLDAAALRDVLEQEGVSQSVEVEMPKWTIESTIDLKSILEKMGVGDAFQETADYSGFTGAPDATFDSVRHKARIQVDEEGTTAAAATAVFLFRSARPLAPQRFVANHPFVYVIVDRASHTVLFAGVYREPRG